jgi:hypothetical protein
MDEKKELIALWKSEAYREGHEQIFRGNLDACFTRWLNAPPEMLLGLQKLGQALSLCISLPHDLSRAWQKEIDREKERQREDAKKDTSFEGLQVERGLDAEARREG